MSLLKNTDRRLPFIFDDLLTTDWFGGTTNVGKIGRTTPAVNITESENDFSLELAVPGLKKEDFGVELNHDVLTISSKVVSEEGTTKDKYTRKEFGYASFTRSFSLPDSVDGTQISANYQDGILSVTLPKKEEAKVQPKRLIEIS